jgi:hypothetical protein
MNNEIIATYYYDNVSAFDAVACYDSWKDYDNRKVSFYDIFDKDGLCVNEGDPIYSLPTWDFVRVHYYKRQLS